MKVQCPHCKEWHDADFGVNELTKLAIEDAVVQLLEHAVIVASAIQGEVVQLVRNQAASETAKAVEKIKEQ